MKILSSMIALISLVVVIAILMPEVLGYIIVSIAIGVIVANYRLEWMHPKKQARRIAIKSSSRGKRSASENSHTRPRYAL